jgi:hypothetical protein
VCSLQGTAQRRSLALRSAGFSGEGVAACLHWSHAMSCSGFHQTVSVRRGNVSTAVMVDETNDQHRVCRSDI